MNIVEIIKDALDDMTRSERQVASYYLAHPNDFAFCTLDAIAEKIDISTTSVLRFTRRIGFKGYKDFQQAVQSQINMQPQLPEKFQRSLGGANLLLQKVARDVQCIQETFASMNEAQISGATELVCRAERVFTFGARESYALAHYAYTRLLSVRPDVSVLQVASGQIESVLSLGAGDVCIVFLFHRYTRQTVKLLELLKQQNASVILVTDPPYEDIANTAEILLPCLVDCGGIKNTAVAPVVLMDYLCDAVAAKLGDRSLEYMKNAEALFRFSDVL